MEQNEQELVKELITLMREKDTQHAETLKVLTGAMTQQAQVLQSWMDLFKPPAEPLRSSTPESRATAADLRDETGWEPITTEEVAEALASIGV